jgi:hypothetical protein
MTTKSIGVVFFVGPDRKPRTTGPSVRADPVAHQQTE